MLQHIVLSLMCIFQNLLFQNLSIPPSWQAFWLVSPYIISVNGTLSLALHLEHCIGISDLPPRYIQILSALQHYLLLIVINFSVILHCYAWKLTELFFFFKLHVWEVSWSTYYTNWTLLFPWLVIETWYGLILIGSLNLLLPLSLASEAIHTWSCGQRRVSLATAIFFRVLVLKCCHQKKNIINNWWAHY